MEDFRERNTILLVDDDKMLRTNIASYLEDNEFEVYQAEGANAGLQIFQQHNIEVVLLDIRMPGMDGLQMLGELQAINPDIPVIMISGTGDIQDAVKSLQLGAYDFISKPITDMQVLEKCIAKALTCEVATRRYLRQHLQEEASNVEDDIWIGKQLARYKILNLLGCGSTGAVYQAMHTLLDRMVALKILYPTLIHPGKKVVTRFILEAKCIASVQHPNIVQLYNVDFDKQNGVYYLVMEYVQGKTLAQILEDRMCRDEATDVSEAIFIGRQICKALEAAHQQGIIHRDVKPGNIMIADDGAIKLTDFGLANWTHAQKKLTQSGDVLGTPMYYSPECIMGEILDERTDLYSLGATLFHVLANEPPYIGDSSFSISLKHLEEPVPSIEKRRPDIPTALDNLIAKLLAKNPGDRYVSATQVRELLDQCRPQTSRATAGFGEKAAETVAITIGKHTDVDKIKVLIVDDSMVMCRAIAIALQESETIKVVGMASNGQKALEAIPKLQPDVITMDLNMPVVDGMTTLKQIMARYPCSVIMLSAFTYEGAITSFRCLAYGAVDFIWKSTIAQQQRFVKELKHKIRRAAQLELVPLKKPRFFSKSPVEENPKYRKAAEWLVLMVAGEGGCNSYLKIIPHIPKNMPCTLVIIQQMQQELLPIFTKYLNHYSKIVVRGVSEREALHQGICYVVNQPIGFERQSENSTSICENLQEKSLSLSQIFASAVAVFENKVIGVGLSGDIPTAIDGFKYIKQLHGQVLIQKPSTCLNPAMCQMLLEQNLADKVVLDVDLHSVLWHLLKKCGALHD